MPTTRRDVCGEEVHITPIPHRDAWAAFATRYQTGIGIHEPFFPPVVRRCLPCRGRLSEAIRDELFHLFNDE